MRPGLPVLEPLAKGVVLSIVSVAGATIGAAFFLATVAAPSPDLLRTMALIGASFILAYVVEAVWLVQRVEIASQDEHEEWLGFLTGVGIAGLLGMTAALLVAEHRAAGYDNTLDDVGAAWAAVSLAILGGLIVLQPLLADRFGADSGDDTVGV
jgi:hypothetical protein